MISKPALRTLINRYIADAHSLMQSRRYATAIYLCGYAVELSLKYKICNLLKFTNGYPETDSEFNTYKSSKKKLLDTTITSVSKLKIHDLNKLLFYSGEQLTITTHYISDWNILTTWSVWSRYNSSVVRRASAEKFCLASKRIIAVLLRIS